MKIVEEKYLKSTINKLNIYATEHSDFLDFFNVVDDFLEKSLQEQSFKGDLELFNELSFILSVITTIISKPHIASKGEEIILRSELAPSLSNEMFQKTLRDSTIWTQEGFDMVPQYVYYYQYVDELKIYENIFIGHLIQKLDVEISKYNDFYHSMVHTFESREDLSKKDDYTSKALAKLNLLNRKIKFIKGTHFYKVIRKDATKMKVVHPTNILTKDRLYNYCYKFYKKMITYIDESEKTKDFRAYYYIQVIKALKDLGFKVKNDSNSSITFEDKFVISTVEFELDDYSLKLYAEDANNGLVLEVKKAGIRKFKKKSINLLVFDTKTKFDEIVLADKDYYDSVEITSLWNFAHAYNDVNKVFDNHVTEQEIVKYWIESKLKTKKCSMDLYSKYCPSCKSTEVLEKNGAFHCEDCHSKYVFFGKKNHKSLWFLRYRKKSY